MDSRGRRQRRWCSEACRIRAFYDRSDPSRATRRQQRVTRVVDGPSSKIAVRECLVCLQSFTVPAQSRQLLCAGLCRDAYRAASARAYRRDHPEKFGWTESKKAAAQRRRAVKKGANAEKFTTLEIAERDQWRCGLCGRKVAKARRYPDPMSASLDHIVPLSKGGEHSRANVQLAHLGCNTKKRTQAVGEQLRLVG